MKLKKGEKKERPYLTDEDVRRLIFAAEGHPWQIGIIILAHGLRISEMLALRHYAARTMVRSGSPAAAARVLGHSSAQTTLNHYVSENLAAASVAVDALEKAMASVI